MLELIYREISDFARYSANIGGYLLNKGIIDEATCFYVKLAIAELAGNVVRHSGCDANVKLTTDLNDIIINIAGGNCFEYGAVRHMPDCGCESGRGIVIVKNIAKSLVYSDGGKSAVCVIDRGVL